MSDLKLLVVTPAYPHPGVPMAGIFNQRSAEALAAACSLVEVLAPRPLVPPGLRNRNARWKAYSQIPKFERRNGINIYRPGYIQVPGLGAAFWSARVTYAMARRLARRLHAAASFDAILSFDLLGGGSLAWRLGSDLGLFTAGWALGGEVRVAHQRGARRVVRRTLQELDLVFYQSSELMAVAAELRGKTAAELDLGRNVVLAQGIPAPPVLDREACRARWRSAWNVSDREILVIYIGRVTRLKGAYELLAAAERTASSSPLVRYVVIGLREGFDEGAEFSRRLSEIEALRGKFLVLPACAPSDVWSYLSAADIAAFPSHAEGMPNGLLEALAMELPAVAFEIPPVREIDPHSEFILTVPALDAARFADALEFLARTPEERRERGKRGSERVLSDFLVSRSMARAVNRIGDCLNVAPCAPLDAT